MHRVATCLLLLFLSPLLHARADEGTYCEDPAVWKDWQTKAIQQAGCGVITNRKTPRGDEQMRIALSSAFLSWGVFLTFLS